MKPARPAAPLRVIAGRPISEPLPQNKLERARTRYGQQRPFAHEPGSTFVWQRGPTVLTEWLRKRGR